MKVNGFAVKDLCKKTEELMFYTSPPQLIKSPIYNSLQREMSMTGCVLELDSKKPERNFSKNTLEKIASEVCIWAKPTLKSSWVNEIWSTHKRTIELQAYQRKSLYRVQCIERPIESFECASRSRSRIFLPYITVYWSTKFPFRHCWSFYMLCIRLENGKNKFKNASIRLWL